MFKNILVIGYNGFIGRNFIEFLKLKNKFNLYKIGSKNSEKDLKNKIKKANIILHFAGHNRPINKKLFFQKNFLLTKKIIKIIGDKKIPIVYLSSVHVHKKNSYGESKLLAEKLLFNYSKKNLTSVYIFRLPHVMGKWCKPNYNSIVSTLCHNIARNIKTKLFKVNQKIEIVYINNLIEKIYSLFSLKNSKKYKFIKLKGFSISIKKLKELIFYFNIQYKSANKPLFKNKFESNLYSVFLTYLPVKNFFYQLKCHKDKRGGFLEFLKDKNFGQISYFYAEPGQVRGQHFHRTKNEKFLVINGKCEFVFKNNKNKRIYKEIVNENQFKVIQTIPGYSHKIKNIGKDTLKVLVWANEVYDKLKPDTYSHKF